MSSTKNAPSLTLENVLNVAKKVKSWRLLAKHLIGEYPIYSGFHSRFTNLDEIQHVYVSDEASIEAVLEEFLTRNPSWRKLIWSLYNANEFQLAQQYRSYTEPVRAVSLTVDSVTKVMELVSADKVNLVWERLNIPEPLVKYINETFSPMKEQIRACVDLYVNCFPDEPSWMTIVSELYSCDEMAAAREAKPFYHYNDKTLTVSNLVKVMETVKSCRRREVWRRALEWHKDVPSCLTEIYATPGREMEKLTTLADVYVNIRPVSSWQHLLQVFYADCELRASKEAKSFLDHYDPTFTTERIAAVMDKVTIGRKRKDAWVKLLGWDARFHIDEIFSTDNTLNEKMLLCCDTYVNCYPGSSWEHLTSLLFEEDEMTAVDLAKPFLPPRDLTLTINKLSKLFEPVKDPERVGSLQSQTIGQFLGLPLSIRKEIKTTYQNPSQWKIAYLDMYTHRHPCPSWKRITETLRQCDLYQHADEVEHTYVQVSERTKHNYEIAMMEGTLMIRNGDVFFLGPGGSGKTHTLVALLGEDPPSSQESTPCAKKPIRSIAHCKVGVNGVHFIRITDDEYSDMVSSSARQLKAEQSVRCMTELSTITDFSSDMIKSATECNSFVGNSIVSSTNVDNPVSISSPNKQQQQPGVYQSGLRIELLRRMQAVSKTTEHLDDKDLFNMRDSGGQPMFHEVLPLFVKNTTFGILTVKLNEPLDSHPLVEYYMQ